MLTKWHRCGIVCYGCLYELPAASTCAWYCLSVSNGSGRSPRNVFRTQAMSFVVNSSLSRSITSLEFILFFSFCWRPELPGILKSPSWLIATKFTKNKYVQNDNRWLCSWLKQELPIYLLYTQMTIIIARKGSDCSSFRRGNFLTKDKMVDTSNKRYEKIE